ncbi:MAG: hypothetical protein H6918_11140 [Sphingomonadaceae bacterium]|nr:hypothetical protein [Sphingomonadaceae bacterium]
MGISGTAPRITTGKLWHAGRIFFGAWFVYAGAEYFLPQFEQPLGEAQAAHDFTVALIGSGLFAVVKAVEFVVGVLMLANRFVPATLVINMPISIGVAYWNFVLEHGAIAVAFGVVCLGLNLALMWPFRKLYLPFLVWKV